MNRIHVFNPLASFRSRSRWGAIALLGLAIVSSVSIACASAPDDGSGPKDDPVSQPGAVAVGDDEAVAASSAKPADDGESASGLDLECVNSVLGREVTGFGDVSTAERDRIFSQCSGDNPAPQPGDHALGTERFAGLLECASEALGREIPTIQDLTAEDRVALAETCGNQLGGGRAGLGESGIIGGAGGRGFGGFGGFNLDSPCISEALGRVPSGPGDLSPQDFEKLAEACGDVFGGGDHSGGAPGGGFFGDGGAAGQHDGALDLTCLSDALGRDITDPAELSNLTREDSAKIAEACGGQFGFPGFGTGDQGGQGGLFRGDRGAGGGPSGGFSGGRQAIDQECVASILGGASGGLGGATAEQRTRIFAECTTQSE